MGTGESEESESPASRTAFSRLFWIMPKLNIPAPCSPGLPPPVPLHNGQSEEGKIPLRDNENSKYNPTNCLAGDNKRGY